MLSRQNALLQQRLENLGQHHRRLLSNFAIEQAYSKAAKRSLNLKGKRIDHLDAQLRKLHMVRAKEKDEYEFERQEDRRRYKKTLLAIQKENEYHKVSHQVIWNRSYARVSLRQLLVGSDRMCDEECCNGI